MALDPVGIVVDLFVQGLEAYSRLSEQNQEKVRIKMREGRAETHSEAAGLKEDDAALKAEHAALRKELEEENARLRKRVAELEAAKVPAGSSER